MAAPAWISKLWQAWRVWCGSVYALYVVAFIEGAAIQHLWDHLRPNPNVVQFSVVEVIIICLGAYLTWALLRRAGKG
jgi:hypothetical protein